MYPHYNIHPLFDTLPAARQKTYLKVAQGDHSLAQDLYLWNLETTSAVFQTISFVEVTMRNVFDKQLRTWNNEGYSFGWFCIQKNSARTTENTLRYEVRGLRKILESTRQHLKCAITRSMTTRW